MRLFSHRQRWQIYFRYIYLFESFQIQKKQINISFFSFIYFIDNEYKQRLLAFLHLSFSLSINIITKRLQIVSNQIGTKDTHHIYSIPVTPKKKGQTPIYRNINCKDGLFTIPSGINSLINVWDQSVNKFANNLFIEDYTFKQVDQMARKIGSWISNNNHNIFYMYCLNSPYWTLTDVATWNYGFTNIPLYDTLGFQPFSYILKVTQGTLMLTTKSLINNLYSFLKTNKFNLKEVCLLDQISNQQKKLIQSLGIKVTSFKSVLNYQNIIDRPILTLQKQLSYIFTSGTTGIPKGVIYTHKMVISTCYAMKGFYEMNHQDIHMSFLPIAHIFERFISWVCIFYGVNIRYTKYPITQILKDFAAIRPTTVVIVPRLLNKFYPIMKNIVKQQGNYQKVRNIFGSRLKRMLTGSAPVSPTILTFFSQVLQADVREGYGQTQTTGASFMICKGQTNYGHVGGPNNCTQFKLVDVPQMNYLTDNQEPKGEICLRGPVIFSKYFNDPINTSEIVDEDGWNHTGDIGVILPNGALKIIDRKKNIFKMQQGQYIAPQKIENIYARCKFVAESFVYRDSMREYTVAIIHPNLQNLPLIAQQLSISDQDVKKLCQNEKINEYILKAITKQGKNDGLLGFEMVKKIKLWHQPFQQVGIVTSTMKLQRFIAKKKFQKQLAQLYR